MVPLLLFCCLLSEAAFLEFDAGGWLWWRQQVAVLDRTQWGQSMLRAKCWGSGTVSVS